MAIRIFATESMVWRTVGLIAPEESLNTIEEYAIECSIVKVYASEMLDYVVDEGVQIHGGYGYHQDFTAAVERAYCDSRINRIFEGTNEINRLLITGMLLKRAARGQLALVAAAQKVVGEVMGQGAGQPADAEALLVANAKKIALLAMGIAYQKFALALEKQQEVLMSLADIVMETYAMESAVLRVAKNGKPDAEALRRISARCHVAHRVSPLATSSPPVPRATPCEPVSACCAASLSTTPWMRSPCAVKLRTVCYPPNATLPNSS